MSDSPVTGSVNFGVNFFGFLVKRLGLDKDVLPSEELVNACSFINVNPVSVIVRARFLMLLSLVSFLVLLSFTSNALFLSFSVPLSLGVYYLVTESPKVRAREERLKGLGYAPEIVTVLGSSLELNPNLERAVRLVGESCSGRISYEFGVSVKNCLLNGYSLIDSFTDVINDWGVYSEGFRHGMQLLKASLIDVESRRDTIERGMNSFFNGLINDLRKYLGKTKTHTLVLFSFGTIIPLVLISLLPVIGLLNIEGNPWFISGVLLVNLLLVSLYSHFILKGRPASFSQVDVAGFGNAPRKGFLRLGFKGEGFDVPSIPYCIFLFLVISSVSFIYLFSGLFGLVFPLPREYALMPLIFGFSVSLSVYFHGTSHYFIKARVNALRVESELLDVIYLLASKLEENRSFEDSLRHVIVNGKDKLLVASLSNAYVRINDFLVAPETAVMDELVKTGSKRAVSIFMLVFHALRQGVANSAKSVFRIYEHYNRMVQSEAEHNGLLEQVLSMMRVTSLFFAPLISAFIVLMQALIESNTLGVDLGVYGFNLFSKSLGFEFLELILGFYTIGLTVVLTVYEVRLSHGSDNVLLKHELSKNVLISCSVFLSTLIIAGLLM